MPDDPLRESLERALGAQYEIVRLLGRGGMGAVYLARERSLERAVAIKVLPPNLAQDAESRERFRREARTAANLTHANIVPLHAFGDVDGMLYFVMGYVRGESLAARLKREQKLSPDVTRRILGEVADALDYAHRQGVVHRDIKPDNVLLDDETGRPMLTDFGVAKARASGATLTETGMIVGTPHFMSPEQASGERTLDGRSDLYSLGVMGYVMLAGRLPFDGDSLRDVLVKHVTQEPPSLAALAPEAPPELIEAIRRCLSKDPANRWADARGLREALGASVDDIEDMNPIVQRLQGGWLTSGLLAVAWGVVGWGLDLARVLPDAIRTGLLSFFGVAAALMLLTPPLQAFVARLSGVPWSKSRHLLSRPPRWWRFWYPRRWRDPADVWDRLPDIVRRARMAQGTGFVALVAFLLYTAYAIGTRNAIGHVDFPGWWSMLPAVVFIGLIGPSIVAVYWGKKRGLNDYNAHRLFFTSTSRLEFWRKPVFAALLRPATAPTERLAEPRGPAEYLAAVIASVSGLGGPARELGATATDAARQVVGSLASLDAEIANLARDANLAELAQVEQKISALGSPGGDNDARRRMRSLLEGQRDLLRGLATQLEAAEQRRTHLTDLLRTLWLQVASLRAEAAHDALAETTASGKIRAACEEIGNYLDAAATVRFITTGKK